MDNKRFLPKISPEDKRRLKDWNSRLKQYVLWLDITGQLWFYADLVNYLDYLIKLGTLQPATIRARMSSVQTRYSMLNNDPEVRIYLDQELKGDKREVEKCLQIIRSAASFDGRLYSDAPRKIVRSYCQLTTDQASQFLNSPNSHTLRGLRDTTIIALIMSSGLRETELKLLTVDDLKLNGRGDIVGVHVPKGPASTERCISFYEGFPIQNIIRTWLLKAGIQEGSIFRGFYPSGKSMRSTAITLQAIEDIFSFYPLMDGEIQIHLKPIDLRVFYAQLLYKLDYDLDVISKNLGVQTQTAVNYIGTPSENLDGIPILAPTELNNFEGQTAQKYSSNPESKIDI